MSDPKPSAPKRARAPKSAGAARPAAAAEVLPAALARRVIVEQVQPELDAGRFPIKRTPGEAVVVTVVVLADGHDVLAGVLRYRNLPAGTPPEAPWQET